METNPNSNTRVYITSDGIKYELDYDIFSKYSSFIRDMEPEEVRFNHIHSNEFKYIIKYLEIRKQNPETKVFPSPLPRCDLSQLVSKQDYDFVQQIKQEGSDIFTKVLSASIFLQMDYLKRMLLTQIALSIINKDPQELRAHYNIKELTPNQQSMFKQKLAELLQPLKKSQ